MKTKRIRIALAQINPVVGDLRGNASKIMEFIRRGEEKGADIIAFPELAITGYPPEDLLLKRGFIRDNLKVLKEIVKKVSNSIVILGFVNAEKERIYNSACVIQKKAIKGIYSKIHLPNYGVFDEKRYFTAGGEINIFEIGKEIAFGVNICEDIWVEEGPSKIQAKMGAGLIINISASPYHAGKEGERIKMLKKRARDTGAFISYVNLVGGQDELVFDGGSVIISPEGRMLACAKMFEEDLLLHDILLEKRKTKERAIKLETVPEREKPPLEKRERIRMEIEEEIYRALLLGVSDYVKKNGFEKVVLGLSGGIDSALTAVIATDALGRDNVVALSMPSRYSSEETKRDAQKLAENLGIKLITVPIDGIFETYLRTLEVHFGGLPPDITEENLQARIRGNILMAFSNKFGWLVLNTGNKSELSTGYCTLYGDMVGGFGVLKDVPKTMVYRLAEWRNRKEGGKLIPETIFTRPPTAELKPDQKDQDTLPPYEVLDVIIKKYVEEDRDFKEIINSTGFNPELVKEVIGRIDRNEYKRRQSPPGVKITHRAFGKDRRVPITNRYMEGCKQ